MLGKRGGNPTIDRISMSAGYGFFSRDGRSEAGMPRRQRASKSSLKGLRCVWRLANSRSMPLSFLSVARARRIISCCIEFPSLARGCCTHVRIVSLMMIYRKGCASPSSVYNSNHRRLEQALRLHVAAAGWRGDVDIVWTRNRAQRPGYFFDQRLAAAFLAISRRLRADMPSARAFPPMRPKATAAAFLPSSVVTSLISPVAILAIMTARVTSAGRFWP